MTLRQVYCLAFGMAVLLSGCGGSTSPDPAAPAASTGTIAAGTNAAGVNAAGTNPAQILPPGMEASPVAGTSIVMGANTNEPVINAASSPVVTPALPSGTGTTTTETSTTGASGTGFTSAGTIATSGPTPGAIPSPPPEQALTEKGAFRLLQQGTFGASEAGITEVMAKGPRRWLAEQFAMPTSTYGYRDRDAIHKWPVKDTGFCDQFTTGTPERDNCWRDYYSSELIKLDFFKQASMGTDQLRQRMAHALSQIIVTSEVEVDGLYGLADYNQRLREASFANYRDVLMLAATHPMMGRYLNMVDNDASDPNENFARELLQLFSIGTCELNVDGTLKGGRCEASYNNDVVREYAHALTGWTYPVGGVNPWCTSNCGWTNPRYVKGLMVSVESAHSKREQTLLRGTKIAAGATAPAALNAVIDSLMNHSNIAPFIAKQMIQFFVKSNPSPAYVARVAGAFSAGKYETFGAGTKGDLKAIIAAVLLDSEARDDASADSAGAGKLREPIILMVNAVRALNGYTDGERMGKYGWGSSLSQPVFNSPSVFNFYTPDYPLPGAGAGVVAPQFQLVNANTSIAWVNFANDIVYWWHNKGAGLAAKAGMPGAIGTKVSYVSWEADAPDANKLIDRLDRVLTGGKVSTSGRSAIATALASYTSNDTWLADANNQSSWQRERVKTAAYLLLASSHFQVQR